MCSRTPLVSVIIPVYKTEKYLKKSVKSILNQTYKHIEVILVDDGSPDRAPELCDELANNYENVKAIHKENGGLSDARNCGIKNSSGKYILFLDSDDTLAEDTIELMLAKAINENADIVMPTSYYKIYEDSDKKVLCRHFDEDAYISNPKEFALNIIIGKGRAWRASAILYNMSMLYESNALFPVGYTSEDIFFNLEFMSRAKKISFIDEPTLLYLQHTGTITSTFNKDFFKTILYIDKAVCEFLNRIGNNSDEAQNKRYSLLSRNIITYLFCLYKRSYKVDRKLQKEIFNEIVNNKIVKQAFKTKMEKPYFNQKFWGSIYVLVHDLLKYNFIVAAILVIKILNLLR